MDPGGMSVFPQRFVEQIELLKRTVDLVSLEGIASAQSDPDLPAITFDDGYADVLIHAKPVLECFRVPATAFITTDFLDTKHEVWSDELASLILLSDEDPLELAQRLNLAPQ
jgi:peptidoglycan/xylan/chitin deacetylase (PgdA/CDA1 family)